VVDEKPLSASKDGESSPLRKISLVSTSGTDDGMEGYYTVQRSCTLLHPLRIIIRYLLLSLFDLIHVDMIYLMNIYCNARTHQYT